MLKKANLISKAVFCVACLLFSKNLSKHSSTEKHLFSKNLSSLSYIYVVAEPSTFLTHREPEFDSLSQTLKILESQYVEKDRVDTVNLLNGGLQALKDNLEDIIFEYSPYREGMAITKYNEQDHLLLCSENTVDFHFCENMSFTAETPPTITEKSQEADVSKYFIRIKNRVLIIDLEEQNDIKYLSYLISPIISELARASNRNVMDLVHIFLNGLLNHLDPHSSFLNAAEYKELQNGTRGYFDGVGITLNSAADVSLVEDVIPGSPADFAGIINGDVIVQIENSIALFQPLELTVQTIRNANSSHKTSVWLYRPKNHTFLHAFLQRKEIVAPTVETLEIPKFDSVFYSKLSGFSSHTAEELFRKYEVAQKKHRLKSMILDLRGNPGGLLEEAVAVVDLFIRHGKIVSVKSRVDLQEEMATPHTKKIDLPLVVLINASSASASEIVAGALKDQNRAIIVGERSFGKGSVQSIFDTGFGTALKLTVAHHLTPSGNSIQSTGVTPHISTHILINKDEALWETGASEVQREGSLPLHLNNPFKNTDNKNLNTDGNSGNHQNLWIFAENNANDDLSALNKISYEQPIYSSNTKPKSGVDDPVARVALFLTEFIRNKPCTKEGITSKTCLNDATRASQKIETQMMPSNIQSNFFISQRNSFENNNYFSPLKINLAKNNLELDFTADQEEILNGLLGLRIVSNEEDSPIVWVPYEKVKNNLHLNKIVLTLPKSFVTYLSLSKSAQPQIEISFKKSLLYPASVIGNVWWPKTASKQTALPEITSVNEPDCAPKGIPCHIVKISWPQALTQGIYQADFIKLATPNIILNNQSSVFTCSTTGCENIQFELTNTNITNEARGIIGIIIRNNYGEFIGKWPILTISGKNINLSQYSPKQLTLKTP